jgi:hypothetical protein
LQDQLGIARAYCNLGLAHKALHNFMDALECQKKCLSMMKNMKNTKGIFRALGNIGDIRVVSQSFIKLSQSSVCST